MDKTGPRLRDIKAGSGKTRLFDPNEKPSEEMRKILADPTMCGMRCILCGGEPDIVGVFVPSAESRLPQLPPGAEGFAYALCGRCFAIEEGKRERLVELAFASKKLTLVKPEGA